MPACKLTILATISSLLLLLLIVVVWLSSSFVHLLSPILPFYNVFQQGGTNNINNNDYKTTKKKKEKIYEIKSLRVSLSDHFTRKIRSSVANVTRKDFILSLAHSLTHSLAHSFKT